MRIAIPVITTALWLCSPSPVAASDASLVITEDTINRIIETTGSRSDSGIGHLFSAMERDPIFVICEPVGFFDCPELGRPEPFPDLGRLPILRCREQGGGVTLVPTGETVVWQWWVSNVGIEIDSGQIQLTATVTTNVDGHWNEVTRTVNVRIWYENINNRLMLIPDAFEVPLEIDSDLHLPANPVDVAALYTLSLPIHPQRLDVELPGGARRQITGKVESMEQYVAETDSLRINFNVSFENN